MKDIIKLTLKIGAAGAVGGIVGYVTSSIMYDLCVAVKRKINEKKSK